MVLMMLILSTFVVLFLRIYCSMEGDKNACYDANLRGYYCCAHFEEINGTCVECQSGFKSRQSEQCIPCSNGFYGHRCLSVCQCYNWQRCDNAEGCVDRHDASTMVFSIGISTNNARLYTKLNANFTPLSFIYNTTGLISTYVEPSLSNNTLRVDEETSLGMASYSSSRPFDATASSSHNLNVSVSTNQTLNRVDSEMEKSGISNSNLMIYSGTVTGIIMILVVCYIYHRFKTARTNLSLIREEARNASVNETNVIFQINEGVYHTIDESQMIELTETTNSYLNDDDTSDSSEGITNINDIPTSDHLSAYTSLTVTTDVHPYETCQSVKETSAEPPNMNRLIEVDFCSSLPSGRHSLEDKLSIMENILLNRSDTDSSDDEESDSGYIKPCRQIGTETDIKYVYDISVTSSTI